MLNKELLLVNPEKELEYTHTITVGTDDFGVGYDTTLSTYGDIKPGFFLEKVIKSLSSGVKGSYTDLIFAGSINAPQLYLARVDTKEVIELSMITVEKDMARSYTRAFFLDDVGKIIPIWLGTTPPLGLEDSLGLFLKEALYVK